MAGVVVATVKIVGPDGITKNYDLRDGESLRMGRMEGVEIRLDDASVSRTHAMLSASPSGVVVSDLTSTNGTYVNGVQVKYPVDLQPSDIVDVGPFKVSVMISGSDAVNSTTVAGRTMTAQLKPTQTVVLVARVRNYKVIRENLSEEEMNKTWTWWRSLVEKHVTASGGRIDKVLDECILAVWYGIDGAKVSTEAIKVAQAIDLATRQYSVAGDWKYHDRFPLTCSLALNSGMALTGSVGGANGNREFAVLGDTINVAFRVAELTEALAQSVFISEDVALRLTSAIRTQSVGAVTSKDTNESVNVFAVQL